ncbi:SusC/RagA family TonB-linked outer membrane protein [Parafilimonas sp.]|uniref:SusC/RagA family TonB-linked outer membrane protein n=1 Tax=Parafilimonas sp. TaxID=1969739 RepID=UPI0039E57470
MNLLSKKLLAFFVCLLVAVTSIAQSKTITGKVISADDGGPLAGVSISVKGKPAGTSTSNAGDFSINAEPTDVLQVSYVGFTSQEVPVGENSSFTISLISNAGKLGEVVVVGYGTQNRRNVTSAIAKLDNKVLETAPRSNIGTALQGSVPGLQVVNSSGTPGSSPLLILRGGASISSPGSPLVIIDGVIRSYNDIASEDIASVELLKDAAATAIYGARANNGVILITTKQGKTGKAEISYKYTHGYNQRREGYTYLNAHDYIYYNRLGNLNSGRTLAQVNASRGYGLLTDDANLATFDIRSYSSDNAYLLDKGWDTVGDPYGGTIIFKDHSGEVEDIVFRNTNTQDHYIDVSGGNDKAKYLASFDYYNEDGTIVGSYYKRYSGNINGSYKVKPNVEVSTGATMSTSSQIGVVSSEVNTLYRTLALWPTFNPWMDSAKTLPNPGNGISDGNPLYWLSKYHRSNEVNRISANAAVKWDVLPGLYIKGTGNFYLAETLSQSFQEATQLYTNIYADPQTYNSTTRPSISYFGRDFQQQYNVIINYTKTFAEKHHLNVMLGSEYYDTKAYAMQVYGTSAATDDIETANASTTFASGDNYTTRTEYKMISNFGRINYDFMEKYLLTFVLREDGASSLAYDNRIGYFPGMSAGWNVHKEEWFRQSNVSNIISSLKPRISYGQNGNISGLGRYEVQGVYSSQGTYNGSTGFLNSSVINSDLKWEKSKTFDIGADIGLLKDKIAVIFDYYNRKTSDLLTDLSLPSYLGFSSVTTNLGTLQNKGYEVTVNANIITSPKGFSWSVSTNASFVKNKILQLPYNGNDNNRQGGLQVYDPKQGEVVWVGGLQEGQAMGAIYAYKQVSIFKDDDEVEKIAGNRYDAVADISGPNLSSGAGKITPGDVNWLDVDQNDTIDSRDQVYMGNINPKWTGGFSTNLSYKGFSFYARFDFALGHTIYNDLVARTLGNYQGTFNYIELQKRSWTETNTNTDIPKVYYADQVSAPLGKKNYTRSNNANAALNSNNSRFYEKGDYLACREISLSYTLPKSFFKVNALENLSAKLFVSANNLFYITKFSGPSPEPPVNTSGVITGIYSGTYPTPKTFVFGLNVNF